MKLFRHNQKLYILMQALLYPAMLGTFFVLFISKYLDSAEGLASLYKIDFLYCIFLIFYFCISFLVNESIKKFKIYNPITFTCDVAELFLMFFCFSALKVDQALNLAPNLKQFFFSAMLIPVEQLLWNLSLGEARVSYYLLDFLGFIVLLVGFLYGYQYNVFNYTMFLVIGIVIIYYLSVLLSDSEFSD